MVHSLKKKNLIKTVMLKFAESLVVCLHNLSQPPSFYTLMTLWSQQGTFYIIFTEGSKFSRYMETSGSKTRVSYSRARMRKQVS